MNESAIEAELKKYFKRLKGEISSHDRGVIWGGLLAIVPFPPISLIGFFVSAANLWLWKKHKLDYSEGTLIRLCLWTSIFMVAASSAMFFLLASATILKMPTIFQDILSGLDFAVKAIFTYVGELWRGVKQGNVQSI